MSVNNRIQKKMNVIKENEDILMCYFKMGDFNDYENMEIFHTRAKRKRKYTSHKDMFKEFNGDLEV